jgi:hypothetical protein
MSLVALLGLPHLGRLQHAPPPRRDHETTGDPQRAQGDAEETQEIGAGPERDEQQHHRIEANLAGQFAPLGMAAACRNLGEDQRAADRIDDRE